MVDCTAPSSDCPLGAGGRQFITPLISVTPVIMSQFSLSPRKTTPPPRVTSHATCEPDFSARFICFLIGTLYTRERNSSQCFDSTKRSVFKTLSKVRRSRRYFWQYCTHTECRGSSCNRCQLNGYLTGRCLKQCAGLPGEHEQILFG